MYSTLYSILYMLIAHGLQKYCIKNKNKNIFKNLPWQWRGELRQSGPSPVPGSYWRRRRAGWIWRGWRGTPPPGCCCCWWWWWWTPPAPGAALQSCHRRNNKEMWPFDTFKYFSSGQDNYSTTTVRWLNYIYKYCTKA